MENGLLELQDECGLSFQSVIDNLRVEIALREEHHDDNVDESYGYRGPTANLIEPSNEESVRNLFRTLLD
jgi:hypothetical protein